MVRVTTNATVKRANEENILSEFLCNNLSFFFVCPRVIVVIAVVVQPSTVTKERRDHHQPAAAVNQLIGENSGRKVRAREKKNPSEVANRDKLES